MEAASFNIQAPGKHELAKRKAGACVARTSLFFSGVQLLDICPS